MAQLEYSGFEIFKVTGVSVSVDKVDGVKAWTLRKGPMKGVGWRGKWGDYAIVFELTPGVHTFEVNINQHPLTIELNACAGRNYRICAGVIFFL